LDNYQEWIMLSNIKSGVAVLAVFALTVVHASASPFIVQDSYTATTGTSLSTHTPDVNLPGGSYINGNSPFVIGTIAANTATVGNDGAWGISLASSGTYVKPTRLSISADLNLGNMTGTTEPTPVVGTTSFPRGIALSFFSNADTILNERRNPLGVVYNDKGNLLLVVPNYPGGFSQTLAVVSTYQPGNVPIPTSGTHNLYYEINTASGAISNVAFDGFAINFGVATTQFTDANTFYAGNYAGSGDGNNFGSLDNFTVNFLPEPASCGVIAIAAMSLGLRRRR
jgi:hypothetical protein